MLIEEQKAKEFLFEEAEEKKEHRTKIAIHEVLLSEMEESLEEYERNEQDLLEKEAMATGGFSNLKNSAANTSWRFTELDVESAKTEVSRKAGPYFGNLQQNPTSANGDLSPSPMKLLFHYERTIRPLQDPEAKEKSNNAMNVLSGLIGNEFLQFEEEVQNRQIPLAPFFMISKFSTPNGDVDEGNLRDFIWQEQKKRHHPSHYKDHVERIGNGERVKTTDNDQQLKTFKMSEINTATRNMLEYAIGDRISPKNSYTLNMDSMGKTAMDLLNKRLADNKIDSRNPEHAEETDRYLNHYVMMVGRIALWWNKKIGRDEKNPNKNRHTYMLEVPMPEGIEDDAVEVPARLTGFELRLLLQHMVPLGSDYETPPDEFKAYTKTNYLANGWDSSKGEPGTNMLTLPPLRQLPRGEVVYDRGAGNMGYNQLSLNWKKGLGQIVNRWGPQCNEWLKILQGPGVENSAQQSPEALDAIRNIMGNRTGAENILDLLNKYPSWEEFERNHLQKSLASEIGTVNELYSNPVELPGFRIESKQLGPYVEQIKQVGANNPEAAHSMLKALSSHLVEAYRNEEIDWDTLTYLLHAINAPVAKMGFRYPKMIDDPNYEQTQGEAAPKVPEINPDTGNPVNVNVDNGITGWGRNSMIDNDKTGFESLKQYGYPVAKMLDLLSAVMYRSCEKIEHTPEGPVRKIGHMYGTSSGISKGGDIILYIRHEKLQASASSDPSTRALQVDVFEKLGFSLEQRSGANTEDPIILRKSGNMPWEQLIDMFNEEYPEAGYSNEVVNEPINRYLNDLQQKVKEALVENKGDIKVIYHDRYGAVPLSVATSVDEGMAVKEDAGETDLVTPEAAQPETQPDPESPESWTMDIGEDFAPDPSAEELEGQILPDPNQPDPNQVPVSSPAPAPAAPPPPTTQPKQKMPRSKPMSNPMVSPIDEPQSRYIQKRDTKSRRLLRQQSGLGTIEERLQKSANKLDECGEFTVADKIDLLLQKIHGEKDVRKTSRV